MGKEDLNTQREYMVKEKLEVKEYLSTKWSIVSPLSNAGRLLEDKGCRRERGHRELGRGPENQPRALYSFENESTYSLTQGKSL